MLATNELLNSFLEKTLSGMDTAVSFLEAEIPEVIKQLLMWNFAYNLILFLVASVLIIIWIKSELYIWKKLYPLSKDEESFIFMNIVPGGLARLGLLVLIAVIVNLKWLMIWIAPKVWLLEYAATLTGIKK